jgi:5-formyltetrahydrofolate cyclo-ligase
VDVEDDLSARKSAARRAVRAALAGMATERVAEESARACENLVAMSEYVSARVVMVFVPIVGEVDARPAARAALGAGKVVAVPEVDWEAGILIPRRVRSVDEGLVERRHGVPEAPASCEPVPVGDLDVVLVPGLAFDAAGRRLGRGGGFYDRFLSQIPARVCRIGLAMEAQVLPEVPAGPDDARVDAVVLPSRVVRCPAREGMGGTKGVLGCG